MQTNGAKSADLLLICIMLRFTFMAQCHVQNELVVVDEEKNCAKNRKEKLLGKNSAVLLKNERNGTQKCSRRGVAVSGVGFRNFYTNSLLR